MKKPLSVVYFPPAEKDLEDIFEYIRHDSPARAANFLGRIDRSIARLSHFPLSGIIPRDKRLKQKGYRLLTVSNYLFFYHLQKNKVIIDRILHGKRKYGFLL